MNDAHPDYPTKVFLDSNIVLEGRDLLELPWDEIDPAGPILILLTPTLLREVDSKKRDGRLGVRARAFNRLLKPLTSGGAVVPLVSSQLRVDMTYAVCERIEWTRYDDLDETQGDDRIVAEVLHARGVPQEQRILVSQDMHPLIVAQRHGLRTHHVADHWLRILEPSPLEKEITRLKQRVSDFEKTEPEFEVSFTASVEPAKVHRIKPLSTSDASNFLRQILAENPMPAQGDSFMRVDYDSSLKERYENYEAEIAPKFVQEYSSKLELFFGQIPVRISVRNVGKLRAESVRIEVRLVGGWLHSKPILIPYRGPSAPRRRSPFDQSFQMPRISAQRNVRSHEFDVDEPDREVAFEARCEDFRHGQVWNFDGVAWIDPYSNDMPALVVSMTAANLRGTVVKRFDIVRIVADSSVSDLVSLSEGRLKQKPAVLALIQHAIDEERYKDIEMDAAED